MFALELAGYCLRKLSNAKVIIDKNVTVQLTN
jgi:hypothetical protein